MALSHFEARLRLYQGALSRHRESPLTSGGLRSGQSLSAPQEVIGQNNSAVGPAGGVVSLEAGKRPPETPYETA